MTSNLTSKQRAELRAIANGCDTLFQIGKGGMSENLYKQVNEALEARELIKLRVLENSGITAREAANDISVKVGAETVQVIGTRFIIFKRNPDPKKRKIDLNI